jgi:hypothetical protein
MRGSFARPTGKYNGISRTAPYPMTPPAPPVPGTGGFMADHQVGWQFRRRGRPRFGQAACPNTASAKPG